MTMDSGRVAGEDLLLVGDDVVAELGARQQLGDRAGGDDDVVEGHLFGATLGEGHLDGLGVDERALTVVFGDLVLLHEEVHALGAAVRDLAAAVVGGTEVEGHVTGDAEGLGLFVEEMRQLGIAEKRLGGDTAHVQADTTPVLLLDDGGAQSQLCRADSSDVPTGTGSEDNDVIV